MPMMAGRSPEATTRCPFTPVMTSPERRPARAAGPPSSTLDTSAPSGRGSLNESANACYTARTVTHTRACSASPCATIRRWMCVASSIGMANDTPW